MAIYNYTLPSGARYVVDAPTGTTQAQADFIFYSQVAAGSLVGYTRGQTLSSLGTKLTKFELSRLDRGTAGVDNVAILAIISGSPIVAQVPSLINVPLKNPITVADFAAVGSTAAVGPLTPLETQAVIAQIANLVDQPYDEISVEDGIGEYGLGTPQLEQAGYLKPGTSDYPNFNCAISSPSVWTGKDGVYSLDDVLTNPTLQTQMQTQVMQISYNSLTAAGTIQEPTAAPATVSTGQVYTDNGLATLTAASLVTGAAALSSNFNSIVSTSLAGAANLNSLLSNPVANISTLASGAVNTVTQSIASLGTNALATANNLVNTTIGSTIGQATALVTGASNAITGAVGGLIANASQFGAPVTALWAQGQGLVSGAQGLVTGAQGLVTGALGSITGASGLVTGALGSAQSLVTGALGDLTTLASGALGAVKDQASALLGSLGGTMDIFGKMSSFSVDFSIFSSDSLVSPTKVAAGYSNTVNRSVVDAATTRILGDAKIPIPQFQYPSPGALNVGADINFAQNALKSLTSPFTNAVVQAQGAFTQATQLATTAQTAFNRLTG
jgi:hypothetical protein